MSTTDDLPAELAEGLRRVAAHELGETRPWPGVDQAVHRRRTRRRVALAATAMTVLIGLGAGASAVLDSQHRVQNGPAQVAGLPSVAEGVTPPPELRAAGLVGRIGGSLGDDADFVEQLRERVVQFPARGQAIGSPDDVLVFWAGDLSGRRMALAGQLMPGGTMTFVLMHGQPGTSPRGMRPYGDTGYGGAGQQVPAAEWGRGVVHLVADPGPDPVHAEGGTVFVLAPRARAAEVQDRREFRPAGEISAGYRSLEKQGDLVWVGDLDRTEVEIHRVRVDGTELIAPAPSLIERSDLTEIRRLAPPGGDQEGLRLAFGALDNLGATSAERPVIAGTLRTPEVTVSAVVLQSRQDGWLTGVNVTTRGGQEGGTSMDAAAMSKDDARWTSKLALMQAIDLGQVPDINAADRRSIVVVAPTGAATVRAGQVTAPVTGRLALLEVPAGPSVTVEALAADATTVLETVRSSTTT